MGLLEAGQGWGKTPLCITARGNIVASGNLCFRIFNLQLNVINKNVCDFYSAWVNQITVPVQSYSSISYTLLLSKFLAIY